MKEIDKLIRDALRDEDVELFETIGGEQRMHQVILDLFRGRSKWLSIGTIAVTIGLMVLGVYAVVQFYQSNIIRDMFLWGAVAFFTFAAVGAVKVWAWMEMAKNETMREIKRLELQIARLASMIRRGESKP